MKTTKKKQRRSYTYVIKIFIKKEKKAFCEVEVPAQDYLNSFYDTLCNTKDSGLVMYGSIIFWKSDFDYATIEKIER